MSAESKSSFWKINLGHVLTIAGFLIGFGIVKQQVLEHEDQIAEIKRDVKSLLISSQELSVRIAKMETSLEWIGKTKKLVSQRSRNEDYAEVR